MWLHCAVPLKTSRGCFHTETQNLLPDRGHSQLTARSRSLSGGSCLLAIRNKLDDALHCAHVRILKIVLGLHDICEVRISPAGTRVSTNTTPPQIPARLLLFIDSLLCTLGLESIDALMNTHRGRVSIMVTVRGDFPKEQSLRRGHGCRWHPLQSCRCMMHTTPLVMGQPADPSTRTG